MDARLFTVIEQNTMANLIEVLKELEQERSHLDQAIKALGRLVGQNNMRTAQTKANRPKRNLSAAARRKIGAAQRARWARWKTKNMKKAA